MVILGLNNHIYSKDELIDIFENTIGKTLGEVDKNHIFDRTIDKPKITGIAGNVIEESVLGYEADSYQRPDLVVDGIDVELKTTGIRRSKKDKKLFEAKEPMSVTAVSPEKISDEEFSTSNFWHKLEHLLVIYYLYDSDMTVLAAEYAKFPIKGYDFYEFSSLNKKILENDWSLVRDYIKSLQEEYDDPTRYYPTLSSELRPELMMIDIAPKWPNRPRFRLKRATVTTLVQQHFGKQFESLDTDYNTFKEIDEKLHNLTIQLKNQTIAELMSHFDIPLNNKGKISKGVTEQIVTKMFGAKVNKMNKIDVFNEIGLRAKTTTWTVKGGRTEDTKLFPVDFEEWTTSDKLFEESTVYNYFSENQYLFIIFQESEDSLDGIDNNKFIGFKRLSFDDKFIGNEVRVVWDDVREKVHKNKLVETTVVNKAGEPIINKNGVVQTTVNLPKSKDHTIFFRGTSSNSSYKPESVNGISMYRQSIWLKGSKLNNMLADIEFI
ncbi:MutH/Sau3AI family endonuclease [Dellaglioa algida]|nr:MutH/Sau3AI family endonuclease [Dellaglioa algida]MDK1738630.1 MutH/Sau3AI family endonuclease [Dellaglioa algida]